MGLSVKSSSSAIGQFGTGLKYAIAVILRNNLSIRIHSNGVCHTFTLEQSKFRAKDFTMILWHDSLSNQTIPLPFTLDYGLNWDLWMAYRELSSNCKDESGVERIVPLSFTPSSIGTCIEVIGEPFLDLHRTKHEYFISTPPIATTPLCDIHERTGDGLFYKGVRVGKDTTTSFSYNVHSSVQLTEDRTILEPSSYEAEIVRAVVQLKNRSLLSRILSHRQDKGTYEGDFNYAFVFASCPVSEEFLDCAMERIRAEPTGLPYGLKQLLKDRGHLVESHKDYTPSAIELKKLEVIRTMFAKVDIEIPHITFVHTTKEALHGYFDPKTPDTIYITNFGIAQGMHELAQTIYEETNHRNGNYQDCTRSYQNFLQRTIINLIAEKTETLL
jgi:hypothetical protein